MIPINKTNIYNIKCNYPMEETLPKAIKIHLDLGNKLIEDMGPIDNMDGAYNKIKCRQLTGCNVISVRVPRLILEGVLIDLANDSFGCKIRYKGDYYKVFRIADKTWVMDSEGNEPEDKSIIPTVIAKWQAIS